MTDVIADMLTRVRNALIAKHDVVEIPASNEKKEIARLEQFLQDRNIYNKLFLRYIIDREVQLTEKASAIGTMWLRENQMKLDAEGITTWYDGKTRWCYVPTSNEVNIDEPSKKEMAAMNPYTFMGIYKKGFKMTVKETVLRGEAVYEVYLKARYAKMDVKEIYVDIRKSDYQPLCIRVRESNDWQRVSITNFKSNLKFENEFFTFPTNDYPNVLINDMR